MSVAVDGAARMAAAAGRPARGRDRGARVCAAESGVRPRDDAGGTVGTAGDAAARAGQGDYVRTRASGDRRGKGARPVTDDEILTVKANAATAYAALDKLL